MGPTQLRSWEGETQTHNKIIHSTYIIEQKFLKSSTLNLHGFFLKKNYMENLNSWFIKYKIKNMWDRFLYLKWNFRYNEVQAQPSLPLL